MDVLPAKGCETLQRRTLVQSCPIALRHPNKTQVKVGKYRVFGCLCMGDLQVPGGASTKALISQWMDMLSQPEACESKTYHECCGGIGFLSHYADTRQQQQQAQVRFLFFQ